MNKYMAPVYRPSGLYARCCDEMSGGSYSMNFYKGRQIVPRQHGGGAKFNRFKKNIAKSIKSIKNTIIKSSIPEIALKEAAKSVPDILSGKKAQKVALDIVKNTTKQALTKLGAGNVVGRRGTATEPQSKRTTKRKCTTSTQISPKRRKKKKQRLGQTIFS